MNAFETGMFGFGQRRELGTSKPQYELIAGKGFCGSNVLNGKSTWKTGGYIWLHIPDYQVLSAFLFVPEFNDQFNDIFNF